MCKRTNHTFSQASIEDVAFARDKVKLEGHYQLALREAHYALM